ncbi:hypothetical protein GCM10010471_08320 [Leucobacter komagatae]
MIWCSWADRRAVRRLRKDIVIATRSRSSSMVFPRIIGVERLIPASLSSLAGNQMIAQVASLPPNHKVARWVLATATAPVVGRTPFACAPGGLARPVMSGEVRLSVPLVEMMITTNPRSSPAAFHRQVDFELR